MCIYAHLLLGLCGGSKIFLAYGMGHDRLHSHPKLNAYPNFHMTRIA